MFCATDLRTNQWKSDVKEGREWKGKGLKKTRKKMRKKVSALKNDEKILFFLLSKHILYQIIAK